MADTPLSRIEQIVIDTGPYSAEYRPTPLVEKPLTGCDLPPKILSKLVLPSLPVVKDNLDCNLNFIPTPIVVPPFIPPFDNLNCPDGYSFDSQYVSGTGECLTQGPLVDAKVALTIESGTIDRFDLTDEVLPEIYVFLPQTTLGIVVSLKEYAIVAGATYKVEIPAYDPDTQKTEGISYFEPTGVHVQVYTHNQVFKGITGQPKAVTSHASMNDLVVLYEEQHQRVTDRDRTTPFNRIYVNNLFARLAVDAPICKYELRRLVFSTSGLKDTAGIMGFMQKPCGGHLFGEININVADLNLPCGTSLGGNSFLTDSGVDPAKKVGVTNHLTGAAINYLGITSTNNSAEDHSSCGYSLKLTGAIDIPDITISLNGLNFTKDTSEADVVHYRLGSSETPISLGGGSGGGCVGCCRWS